MDPLPQARPLRPDTVVHNDWRGGQVWSIGVSTAVIRLQAEHHMVRDKTIAIALLPVGAIAGDAVVCRVSGANADAYVITEIHSSRFAGMTGPGTDQAGAVARGEFHPGVITKVEDPNLKTFWDE